MCGIAGKVSSHEAVPVELVAQMCGAQVHRGPDSRGIHSSEGAAIGIQRLRVIDLETGDQPIYNEAGTVAVALNGEIYNYRELRRELQARGHKFATNGDTEVIAHLYEDYGAELVHRLGGMFAFAVWDLERRRLVLARDRVGKKPLFYSQSGGQLAFASELHALICDPTIPRELDASSIDSYLAYGYIPAPDSIWRTVKKLPPAHTLVWENGVVETERYWRLEYSPKRQGKLGDLEEELRKLLGAAVKRRMISDVPLGLMLSGGIDSSVVLSEMASISSDPVKTFSIGFEQDAYNELPHARLVAERFGTDHHELVVRPDAVEILPRLVRHYGEPFADSSAIPSFYLAEMTRREVTVALNGDGGDESFGGYLRHVANSATAGLDRIPRRPRAAVAYLTSQVPGATDRRGLASYARRLLESADLDGVERYMDHVSIFRLRERERYLDPDFRDAIDTTRAQRFIRHAWFTAPCDRPLDRLLSVDVNTYLPYDLLVKMDIASMAHGLEARSPFLDHEVMEFAASLPTSAKVSLLRKKRLVRRAYADRLPASVLRGRKRGFAVPLEHWLRGELAAHVKDVLLDPGAVTRDYLNPGASAKLIKEHAEREIDHSAKLWALLVLETWQRSAAGPPAHASALAGIAA